MASGIITGTKYISGGHYWIELHWSNSTVNSTTSTTTVKTYFCSDWAISFSATKNGNTTINGSSSNWSSTADVNHGTGLKKTLIYTRSNYNITHNADGNKTITISGNYTPNANLGSYGTLGTMYASGSAVLNDVNGTVINPNTWVWTGSSWVRGKACSVWTGSNWSQIDLMKAWTGSSWVNTR